MPNGTQANVPRTQHLPAAIREDYGTGETPNVFSRKLTIYEDDVYMATVEVKLSAASVMDTDRIGALNAVRLALQALERQVVRELRRGGKGFPRAPHPVRATLRPVQGMWRSRLSGAHRQRRARRVQGPDLARRRDPSAFPAGIFRLGSPFLPGRESGLQGQAVAQSSFPAADRERFAGSAESARCCSCFWA